MTALIDQASQLRSMVTQRSRANVIAVTSGKGGVGKSNIAVNLAIQFASVGRDVVLLDADLGLANADVLCNIDLPCNLSHVIARKKELIDVLIKAPGGFRLIGGASGLARMADLTDFDRQRIINALVELEQQTDIILIDTGAGISPNVLAFTRAADHVLVVTTPEPTAITDAYAVIKVITRGSTPLAAGGSTPLATTGSTNVTGNGSERRISLLVNQARSPAEARVVYERIAKVARQFLNVIVLDAGHMPIDEQIPQAVRKRTPFILAAPRCAASQSIAQLAMRLEQGIALLNVHSGGFFNRMFGWLRR